MHRLELTIFAECEQFYLQDDDISFDADFDDAWTKEAGERLLAVSDHIIAIGTVRSSFVPVYIDVAERLPHFESMHWDRVNRTTVVCDTGRFVIAGIGDKFSEAQRLEVKKGTYDVAIGYKNLTSVYEGTLEGKDSYHIYLALNRRTPHGRMAGNCATRAARPRAQLIRRQTC